MCKMSFLLLGQWPPSGFDLNFKSDILAKTFVFTFIVHIELGQFLFILDSFFQDLVFYFCSLYTPAQRSSSVPLAACCAVTI